MRHAETVTLGGSELDRAAYLRSDPVAMEQHRKLGTVLLFWHGKPLVISGQGLAWLKADHPALVHGMDDWIFLGLDDGVPRFAKDVSNWSIDTAPQRSGASLFDTSELSHPSLPPECVFVELRAVMTQLSPREAELAVMGKAVLQWHKNHLFCAACGSASALELAGWQRGCTACGAKHYPRTDPVVIMLVLHNNHLLLGRSAAWPQGMHSLLAGFVEPGETLEAAVRREVAEESGIQVGHVRYLASQPWPFPSSLMLGCAAEALSTEITLDPAELEAALWVSREEMAVIMAGNHPRIKPSTKGSISHFLISNWLAGTLDEPLFPSA